jgi:hypothetical protein
MVPEFSHVRRQVTRRQPRKRLKAQQGGREILDRAVMHEIRDRLALAGPEPLDHAEKLPYGGQAGRRSLRFTALRCPVCRGRSRRTQASGDGIWAGGGICRMQRAHRGDQLIRAEWLGEAYDTPWDQAWSPAGDQETPAGRRRVLGHQRLDQRDSSFPAQVGVNQ